MSHSNQKRRSSPGRKSKEVCKKLLKDTLNNSDNSENDFEETQYDSDVDPEFQYSDDSDEEENAESIKENSSVDSDDSVISNFSDFDDTFDLLDRVLNNDGLSSSISSF